jgi:hypothetical protein
MIGKLFPRRQQQRSPTRVVGYCQNFSDQLVHPMKICKQLSAQVASKISSIRIFLQDRFSFSSSLLSQLGSFIAEQTNDGVLSAAGGLAYASKPPRRKLNRGDTKGRYPVSILYLTRL